VGQIVNTFNNLTNNGSLTGNLDVAISNVISALGTGPFYSRFALASANLANISTMAIWIDTVGVGHSQVGANGIVLNLLVVIPFPLFPTKDYSDI